MLSENPATAPTEWFERIAGHETYRSPSAMMQDGMTKLKEYLLKNEAILERIKV